MSDIQKQDIAHHEHGDSKLADEDRVGYVADTLAADYIDPNLHISEAENKRLRRMVFTR